MKNDQPEIELRNVYLNYGSEDVLTDFSLTIGKGQFVTAIGSSGCGKTTALKLMNGLLTPDQGSVWVQGQDISLMDQNKLRRGIGYVIQGIGLFPHMLIRDNISYILRLNKMNKAEIDPRVEELAEIVQLDRDLLSRYPDELSGGQRQRVGIARALASKPPIMLMDEPFGAVDEITRKGLQAEIKRIQGQLGITIFFITHDITEALSLGDYVAVMRDGKIEQYDTPDAIRQKPATAFVKELVG